ncbi:hypothetical protein NJB1907f44_21800 [Mycobacterium marinum]|uniref:Uncharacterized protein n=1 Tax=Mycobacterium shottsii TaxID=133549 RepID=A0A7I7LEU7_9MYCO|nr:MULTISPECIES: hypothetical protein [Mycobacterium ulcerans group]BBX58042.1 hypothetical protein MSHO_33870 [Mycobacterium shottsii]GJO04848.1 hypothetical protein NJB1808e29_31670 [Mycobacterium marinum]GJO09207.1 hypothetical protein NJB1907E90_25630 [Mycobacterium marinum]GJO09328.1 hypothetical protein NJB1907f34b_39150 [Mycobacterium marinum]GJO15141.1 hypothetical protein NJB1907E11_13520 [Mycobacterium marinum]
MSDELRTAAIGNESGSVFDMTNVRKRASAVSVTGAVVAVAAVVATPAISHADPAGHQVTYTVTTTSDLTANIQYMNVDPPSQSAFDADSSKYLTSVHTPITGGQPLVYTATLQNPSQWAIVTASGGLRINPEFHCEIAVDGQVVVSQNGGSGVTCSTRPW